MRRIKAPASIQVDVRLISGYEALTSRARQGILPRSAADVPPHVWEMFRAHRWPGNVRELKNAVQRLLGDPRASPSLTERGGGAPPQSVRAGAAPSPLRVARREAADTFEREYLRAILEHTQGNVTRAARDRGGLAPDDPEARAPSRRRVARTLSRRRKEPSRRSRRAPKRGTPGSSSR